MNNKEKNITDIKSDSKLVLNDDLETKNEESSKNNFWNKIKNYFNFSNKQNNLTIEESNYKVSDSVVKSKLKVFWHFFRLPLIVICSLGVICGIVYPIVITGIGQTAFSYQANGSVIKVKDKNGNWLTYGSEKIGQDFYTNNNGQYLFGRADYINSTDASEIKNQVTTKIKELISNNQLDSTYKDSNANIPQDLTTASGSKVDPQISLDAAKWQIPLVVTARKKWNNENPNNQIKEVTTTELENYINKYSSDGIYGNKTTNILLVNLSIDGII